MAQFGQFLKEVLYDYGRRFWIFWIILYGAMVLLELSRQVFLEILSPSTLFSLYTPQLAGTALINEILGRPYVILPLLAIFLFNVWGFGSLFYSFSGVAPQEAIRSGLKNFHRYAGFIILAGIITALGFILLPILAFGIIDIFTDFPLYFADGETLNPWLALPLLFVLAIPGVYLLVAFSNAPFILLLERKNIFRSLRESIRRVTPRWFMAAIYLLVSLFIAGAAYYLLSWLTFSLKLALIPDLSLRGESMLRVFLYSIPWVIVASFYDLALYHLYRRFAAALPAGGRTEPVKIVGKENPPQNNVNYFSPNIMKAVSALVLVAFIFSFALVPIPVQAGGGGNGIFGIVLALAAATTCIYAGCAGAIILGATMMGGMVAGVIATVAIVASTLHTLYTVAANVEGIVSGCSGDYDPVFGGCTRSERQDQVLYYSENLKFTKVDFPDIPTPEEFASNPNALAPVTFNWQAQGQPGTVNYFSVVDTKTNEIFRGNCSGATGNQCSAGPVATACNLPYEKELQAQIWLASCWQVSAKSVSPTCAGCGGDVVGVRFDFTTPTLPLPRVDIKAGGKDGNVVFKPGVPVTLTWTTEYALTAEASGSWSGPLSTSGSQTVTPQTGNEVYTIIARRGDKSGSDSVSSAPPTKQIQIFDSKGGGSGGSLGDLRIDSFNITDPLNPGDTVTISWSVSGAESCEVDNGIGKIPTIGSADITFTKTTTFTLTCEDADGNTVSAKRTVDIKKIPGIKEIKPE